MLQERRLNKDGEAYVVGPTGTPLTLRDLPPVNTDRWVIRRKAEVVAAVRGGLLSLVAFIIAAPLLSKVALSFRPQEYFALTLFGLSMLVTSLHFFQVSILTTQGLNEAAAARIFPLSALVMVIVIPLVGRALDRFPTHRVFAFGLVVMVVSLISAAQVHDLGTALIYAVAFGVNNGCTMTFFSYMWPRYFGRKHLGSIQGMGQMIGIFGASLGPLPLGIAFFPRRKSRRVVGDAAGRIAKPGGIDDPLLSFLDQAERRSLESFSETVLLAPLFTCRAAIADLENRQPSIESSFATRLANAHAVAIGAGNAGWRPLLPAESLRSGILLLKRASGGPAASTDSVRAFFAAYGLSPDRL